MGSYFGKSNQSSQDPEQFKPKSAYEFYNYTGTQIEFGNNKILND